MGDVPLTGEGKKRRFSSWSESRTSINSGISEINNDTRINKRKISEYEYKQTVK